MSRRSIAAFVLGALLVASAPALANHVSEPVTPLTGVHLRLFNYATGEEVDCSGDQINDRIDWNSVRIEGYVTMDEAPPSEHWKTSLTVWQTDKLGAIAQWPNPRTGPLASHRFNHRWNVSWLHENVPPHGPKATTTGYRFIPISNEYFDGLEGTWAIQLGIRGDATDGRFVDVCVYERVNP